MTEFRLIPSTLALLAFATLCASCPAQKPVPAAAKSDLKVKDRIGQFQKLVTDRKGDKDAEAVELVNGLDKDFASMVAKDKVEYAKGIAFALSSTRVKREPTKDGIYRTVIFALGKTGDSGSKYLASAVENKAKFKGKEWLTLRGYMLDHLGRTKDPKQIKFLLDTAIRSPEDTLMAKAGEALQHFHGEKLAVRKEIAKDLIKKFANIETNANKNIDPGDAVTKAWRDRLAMVADPWNTALQKLTKQNIRKPSEWNTFWNKHKGDNWDKAESKKKR
ncbi:MAG: hypothetical protein KDC87_04430 [Planctomycetes bacterium]|nr:hypothetical protein [Planctomycetota bacterium]MCB9869620.1 hypothetical protein [Planctomycetota bacterium]